MANNISVEAMNEISQHIWPLSAQRNSAGALEISSADVRDLIQEHPTPLFVLDESDVIDRALKYVKSFSVSNHGNKLVKPTQIFYAKFIPI